MLGGELVKGGYQEKHSKLGSDCYADMSLLSLLVRASRERFGNNLPLSGIEK